MRLRVKRLFVAVQQDRIQACRRPKKSVGGISSRDRVETGELSPPPGSSPFFACCCSRPLTLWPRGMAPGRAESSSPARSFPGMIRAFRDRTRWRRPIGWSGRPPKPVAVGEPNRHSDPNRTRPGRSRPVAIATPDDVLVAIEVSLGPAMTSDLEDVTGARARCHYDHRRGGAHDRPGTGAVAE